MKKRLLVCLLLLAMCAALLPSVLAAPLPYEKIRSLTASVNPMDSGWLDLAATISTQSGTATSVNLSIKLYQGSTMVGSWSKDGGDSANWVASYKGIIGQSYYLSVTGSATGGGSTETSSVSTSPKLARQ